MSNDAAARACRQISTKQKDTHSTKVRLRALYVYWFWVSQMRKGSVRALCRSTIGELLHGSVTLSKEAAAVRSAVLHLTGIVRCAAAQAPGTYQGSIL